MTYEPCELHEITNCSTCSGLDKKLAAEKFETVGQSWTAMYPGKCPKCGDEYNPGTLIHRTESGWICCP